MTSETARILAEALRIRDVAANGMVALLRHWDDTIDIPAAVATSLRELGSTYVHEQRIINRLVHDDQDDQDE